MNFVSGFFRRMTRAYQTRSQGMHYKYVVAVGSKSFKEAPLPVIDALHRLNWAAEHSVGGDQFKEFNELLAVGYFEGSAMNVCIKSSVLRFRTNAHADLNSNSTMMTAKWN